jgi:hypothetical protein
MPWVYVWRCKTDDKDREVRLELGMLGREVVKVDGVAVADSYSFRMKRRIPVPMGAGHSAGIEVSMQRLWPEASFSLDGAPIAPASAPRVPLWGWAFALVTLGIFAVPMGPGADVMLHNALRGAVAGTAVGLTIYGSAGLGSIAGLLFCSAVVGCAWAVTTALK